MSSRRLVWRVLWLGVLCAVIGGIAIYISDATAGAKISTAVDASPALVKKGEYLAKLGDCAACHSAPGRPPFAGGLAADVSRDAAQRRDREADGQLGR